MSKPSDLKSGNFIRFNGELLTVVECQHRTPGNLRAFYQAKMRNVKTGKLVEYRFRADEDVTIARVEVKEYQYLYPEGESFVCMDNETFDQINIDKTLFGDAAKFLKEGMQVQISFESEEPLGAEAPNHVELEITYTEPGVKGDTVNNVMKNATLETGAEIKVPLFVNTGEKIKIDTRTGAYVERVK